MCRHRAVIKSAMFAMGEEACWVPAVPFEKLHDGASSLDKYKCQCLAACGGTLNPQLSGRIPCFTFPSVGLISESGFDVLWGALCATHFPSEASSPFLKCFINFLLWFFLSSLSLGPACKFSFVLTQQGPQRRIYIILKYI